MREIKNENKYYLENKVYGAYETRDIDWVSDQNGKKHRAFEDTEISKNEDNITLERVMWVDGKSFTVCSIFPFEAGSNPTDKMLKVIGMDLEK